MTALPTATGTFGEKPVLSFPDVDAPGELAVVVLEQGTGEEVKAGQSLEAHYLGQIWAPGAGGRIFDNSYDRGTTVSFPIGVGAVIAGWDDALVGQQIGSRVLVSIPPHLGYGERGMPMAGIRGEDTLVFVVDIVGAS